MGPMLSSVDNNTVQSCSISKGLHERVREIELLFCFQYHCNKYSIPALSSVDSNYVVLQLHLQSGWYLLESGTPNMLNCSFSSSHQLSVKWNAAKRYEWNYPEKKSKDRWGDLEWKVHSTVNVHVCFLYRMGCLLFWHLNILVLLLHTVNQVLWHDCADLILLWICSHLHVGDLLDGVLWFVMWGFIARILNRI